MVLSLSERRASGLKPVTGGLLCRVAVGIALVSAFATPVSAAQPAHQQQGETPHVRIDGEVQTKSSGPPRWVPYVTAGTATLGIFLVVTQLGFARRAARNERTAAFAERWYAREFQDVASITLSFLDARDPADCVDRIRAWEGRHHAAEHCLPRSRGYPVGPRPSTNDVAQVLFFFEDFGAAYNLKQVNRDIVHETIPSAPVQAFTAAWWFLCWQRGGEWVGRKPWRLTPRWIRRMWWRLTPGDLRNPVETDLYANFEWMVRGIRKRVWSERDEDWPRGRQFVLCLPPTDVRGQRAQWDLARSFSTRLTAYTGDLLKLATELGALSGQRGDEEDWEVVIVPWSIREAKDRAKYRQAVVEALAPALRGLDEADVTNAMAAARAA